MPRLQSQDEINHYSLVYILYANLVFTVFEQCFEDLVHTMHIITQRHDSNCFISSGIFMLTLEPYMQIIKHTSYIKTEIYQKHIDAVK